MGSGDCINELDQCKLPSQKSLEKLDRAKALGLHKDAAETPMKLMANGMASLGPITPKADRENGDFTIDFISPPSFLKKPSMVTCLSSNTNRNGDDHLVIVLMVAAPGHQWMVSSTPLPPVGMTWHWHPFSEYEIWTDVESISDEEMFEAVYENLLEVIVSEQTEGVFSECSRKGWDSDDCKTPPPEPLLNGVAESCPGAPLRPSGKSRNIDLGLIRKLEF
ncbi:uncharacterized protein Pyn_21435 [Prunus yedoensis var. nudiflora]|uniref:Uncharacterized protein n=1 Tax=Prunus yedoensis var. nudiflora TaxID=2094558 RepID=A0A314YRS0_PRUYE|nr:uncharacterized protein Pyn_21435 [Prunus yedoensis var. nudiflora]